MHNSKLSGQQPAPALNLDEYLGDFMIEFKENLAEMNKAMGLLSSDPSNRPLLDTLYRDAHNLKGGANALGFFKLGDFLRQIEISFEPARKKGAPLSKDLWMALNNAIVALERAAQETERSKSDAMLDFSQASAGLKSALAGSSPEAGQPPSGHR